MLDIATFDAARGSGSVLYNALAHPLSAEAIRDLYGRLAAAGGGVAVYDPVGAAGPLALLHPMGALPLASVYVQDVREVSARRLGRVARPVTELPRSGARAVLVAAYDAERLAAQAAPWMPPGAVVATLDDAALPPVLRTNPRRVLDPLNFATNLTFFRDADGLSTRLVTANYWTGYGARGVRLWLRLFDAEGRALATWEEALPEGPGGVAIDSREVRARFGLPEFVGHLFVHVVGAAGHDTVKYVLHVLPRDGGGPTLSCTHDANPWPADRYAGIPAPRPDERVVVWLENAHPVPIPAGAVGLARMGAGEPVPLREAVPPFGMAAMDVGTLLPGVAWPAQLELFAGRHVVRPRYEVLRGGRRRIAHANVERTDLTPDPAIPGLELLGRGFLLPFPVLDRERFRTIVQPTPMATGQADLPLAIEVFAPDGRRLARRFLGRLPRDHALALDLDDLLDEAALRGAGGHAELLYDFREGGGADGWLHAIFRYEDRRTGHAAECSFGSHVYNTILTYKGEPQSYAGPPPGLSTRLFLGLGHAGRCSFAVLIHPTSVPRAAASDTRLLLHDGAGAVLAEARLSVPPSGSVVVWPDRVFAAEELSRAGERGYVLVRDDTCRLFGFHGLVDDDPAARGGFSLDHMFGF